MPQNKGEKMRVGRKRVKKAKMVSTLATALCYSVLTLLDNIDERGYEYSDITAIGKTCSSVRRSFKRSQKQATLAHHFLR
jgi:hypothetical protein